MKPLKVKLVIATNLKDEILSAEIYSKHHKKRLKAFPTLYSTITVTRNPHMGYLAMAKAHILIHGYN